MNHKAIYNLYPNVIKIVHDVAYDANDNEVTIDMDQVNAWQDPNQYKHDRQHAYASIAEQLDMQYWDRVNGTSTWKEHIDAVKAAHPKPTE
jgi:hypothetical protein